MSDPNDFNTYTAVARIHNENTAWNEDVVVDFSEYTGGGHYIVFRNVLEEGYTSSRSYNYIDNIDLHVGANPAPISVMAVTEDDAEDVEGEVIDNVEIANPTGVESYDLDNLTVYPNPTTGMLHIDAIDVTRVDVYDQMGKLVSMFEHERDINLGNLNAGVYMLRVTLPEGVAMRKVVKK